MIAIISSTLSPKNATPSSVTKRYIETIYTINALKNHGFSEIFLLDNSTDNIDKEKIIAESFNQLQIFSHPQYCFNNKGFSEAILILNYLTHLPENTQIFKISARYYPSKSFSKEDLAEKLGDKEIAGICYKFGSRKADFSTRAYLVRDKRILEAILIKVVEEMHAYGRGIYGITSLLAFFKSLFYPRVGTPFQLSLEQSFGRVIAHRNSYHCIKKIHIEGWIGGSEFISE